MLLKILSKAEPQGDIQYKNEYGTLINNILLYIYFFFYLNASSVSNKCKFVSVCCSPCTVDLRLTKRRSDNCSSARSMLIGGDSRVTLR